MFTGTMNTIGMKSFTIKLVTICALVMLLLMTRNAIAGDPLAKPTNAEARDRLTAGNKLYRLREFEKAVEEYKAGALKQDAPVFHYNLGQCFRQLGRYEDAIWHYERFLDRGKPTGQLKDAVDAFVTQMKGELEKKAMTQKPVEPAPDATQPSSEPQREIAPAPVIEPGEPWYSDPIGWGIVGAGGVGLGVSVGLLISAKGLDEDANNEPSQDVRNDLRTRASDRRTLGTIFGIGGGLALIAGVVKLVIHPKERVRTERTAFDIGATRNGIFVMGRF